MRQTNVNNRRKFQFLIVITIMFVVTRACLICKYRDMKLFLTIRIILYKKPYYYNVMQWITSLFFFFLKRAHKVDFIYIFFNKLEF